MTTSDSTEDPPPTNWGRWGLDDELGTLNHISIDSPALAATCRELDRHSFLFVVAAAAITGATGLPVNPLAIF